MFLDLTDDPWAFTGHVVSLSEYADKETYLRDFSTEQKQEQMFVKIKLVIINEKN